MKTKCVLTLQVSELLLNLSTSGDTSQVVDVSHDRQAAEEVGAELEELLDVTL